MAEIDFGKKLNLGQLLENYEVTIPILQRDYAQGREGKEYIRENFLKDIKSCVNPNNKEEHKADFIYGYCDGNEFFPLDGQQRLTTLWLACWYLAVRADKLSYNTKKYLLKFSYETRKSSREFCEKICEEVKYESDTGILDYIKNQTWFLAKWNNDPTINSMLRMIEGTSNTDGIEPVLGKIGSKKEFEKAFDLLWTQYVFYMVPLNSAQMPKEAADRLYVKMNSRGKALNDFENFRADFIDQFTKNVSEFGGKKHGELNKKTNETEELPLDVYVAQKIDGDWSSIFWERCDAGHSDGKTDELLFSVIHRFCLDQLLVKKGNQQKDNPYILKPDYVSAINKIINDDSKIDPQKNKEVEDLSEEEEKAVNAYVYFDNDTQIQYTKYDMYQQILDCSGVEKLIGILNAMHDSEHINAIESFFATHYTDKYKDSIYPVYEKDKEGKKKTYKNQSGIEIGNVADNIDFEWRVLFHGIIKYVEDEYTKNKPLDAGNFNDWMRIVYNITMNAEIDNVETMINCVRKIDELGEDSHDILNELAKRPDPVSDPNNSKLDKQIKEEIIKAKQIVKARTSTDSEEVNYEEIKDMEKYGFLQGCVRFLYTDEKGKVDWGSFSKKGENLKKYFSGDGEYASTEFVRMIAKNYKDFKDVRNVMVFHNIGRQHRGESWLNYFLDENNQERVHHVLNDGKLEDKAQGTYLDFLKSRTFEKLTEKDKLIKEDKKTYGDLRANIYNEKWALYKTSAQNGKMYFDNPDFKRNEHLFELKKNSDFEIEEPICTGEAFFWGQDIEFKYKGKKYCWNIQDEIKEYDDKEGLYINKKVQNASKEKCNDILAELG